MIVYGHIRKRHVPNCKGDAMELFAEIDRFVQLKNDQGYEVDGGFTGNGMTVRAYIVAGLDFKASLVA